MSVKDNYPAIRPSLLLDFANTKALDPRITFSRASTGTYYDGVTHAKAEENLFEHSQDFDNAYWSLTSGATLTADSAAAPDGTTTADSLTAPSGVTSVRVAKFSISVSAGDCAISIFAKPNGKNFISIREDLSDGSANSTWFDVSTGSVGTTDAGHTATIVSAGNGWYRCVIEITANAARTDDVFFYIADSDGSVTVTDDDTGLYIWGAQLEQRSSVTAYTPTTTQPITNYIPVLKTAASGEARFDHDPITGESKGLLIEEQRTNVVKRSEEFDNVYWAKYDASIESDVVVAPDGTLTGNKLIANSSSSAHTVEKFDPLVNGTTYTQSVYAKAGEYSYIGVSLAGPSFAGEVTALFDLSNGTLVDTDNGTTATVLATSIEDVGNGWYRCSVTSTSASTSGGPRIIVQNSGTINSAWSGDGYSGIFIWGAQLEAGAFPTSYIKTTSAQATRSADSASMTGTNFSEWYRQDEGSFYVEASAATLDNANRVMSVSDGTFTNRFSVYFSNATHLRGASSGGLDLDLDAGSFVADAFGKNAFAYAVNDYAVSLNGGTPATSSGSGSLPNVDRLNIGTGATDPDESLDGHIKRLTYYPARLTNAQLQALTEG